MANNRMWLVHEATKTMVLLAKYYPSVGWFLHFDAENVNRFLAASEQSGSMFGDTPWRVRYESSDDPNSEIRHYNEYEPV